MILLVLKPPKSAEERSHTIGITRKPDPLVLDGTVVFDPFSTKPVYGFDSNSQRQVLVMLSGSVLGFVHAYQLIRGCFSDFGYRKIEGLAVKKETTHFFSLAFVTMHLSYLFLYTHDMI